MPTRGRRCATPSLARSSSARPHVIVHLGSHKGSGPEAGAARIVQAVHGALEGMPDWLYLLLENNVGSGNTMAGSLQSLAALLGDVAHPRVGVCIDTAHLWGAGHDIGTAEGVERVIEELDRTIGLPRVRILHVNDSPMALESHRDQHTHLGQGNIGYVGLGAWLTHPAFTGIPAILETPESKPEQEAIRLRTAALLCLGAVDEARELQETALPAGLLDGDAPAATALSATAPEMPGEHDDGGPGKQ